MRRFLWSGIEEKNKDHLVNWEVCYKSKRPGGLRTGNL